MHTPAVQKTAILTLIDVRSNNVECVTVADNEPATVARFMLEFCVRHCLAPSDVGVSLSTIH